MTAGVLSSPPLSAPALSPPFPFPGLSRDFLDPLPSFSLSDVDAAPQPSISGVLPSLDAVSSSDSLAASASSASLSASPAPLSSPSFIVVEDDEEEAAADDEVEVIRANLKRRRGATAEERRQRRRMQDEERRALEARIEQRVRDELAHRLGLAVSQQWELRDPSSPPMYRPPSPRASTDNDDDDRHSDDARDSDHADGPARNPSQDVVDLTSDAVPPHPDMAPPPPPGPPTPPPAAHMCTICQEEAEEMASTKCGHVFCFACLHMAIKLSKRCPTCRAKAKLTDIRRIYL